MKAVIRFTRLNVPPARFRQWGTWAIVLLSLACLNILHGRGSGKVTGDGIQYYRYVRAFVINRDFRLHDSDLVRTEKRSTYIQDDYVKAAKENGGWIRTQYSVGASLLWLPFVAVTHAVMSGLHAVGLNSIPPADGFSMPYRMAACYGTILSCILAVLMIYWLATEMFGPVAGFLGTMGVWFATPLFFNMSRSPSGIEGPCFFAITLSFWLWWRVMKKSTPGRWFVWGLAIGLAYTMRLQNAVMAAFPIMEWIRLRWYVPASKRTGWNIAALAAGCFGMFIPFFIQLLVWRFAFNQWTPPGYFTGIEDWAKWQPLPVLFSARHGLFSSHPFWLFGFLGFLPLLRRGSLWMCSLFLLFIYYFWINQLPFDFWAGHSLGARRFVPLSLLCGLGLAWVSSWTLKRKSKWWLAGWVVLGLVFFSQSHSNVRKHNGFAELRDYGQPEKYYLNRYLPRVYHYTGWPFSWPASIPWAVRWGTTPDRYDWGSSLFIDNPSDFGWKSVWSKQNGAPIHLRLDFSHSRAGYVLERGWWGNGPGGAAVDAPEASVWVNFCWKPVARHALLVLDVFRGNRSPTCEVSINGNKVGKVPLRRGGNRIEWDSPASEWHLGTNRLLLSFTGVDGAVIVARRFDLMER